MTTEPLNVAESEALARAVLGAATYAFFAGGAADERALTANRAAFKRRVLRPRVLVDVGDGRPQRPSSAGGRAAGPGRAGRLPDAPASRGRARDGAAAAGAGTVMCVSTVSEAAPAELAAAAPGAGSGSRSTASATARSPPTCSRRAAAAGFEALVLTVDAPVLGRRERSVQAASRLPESASRVRGTAA